MAQGVEDGVRIGVGSVAARGPASGRVVWDFVEDGADLVRCCLGFVCVGTGFAPGFGSEKGVSAGVDVGVLDPEWASGKRIRAVFRVKGVVDVDDGVADAEVVDLDAVDVVGDSCSEDLEEDAVEGGVGEAARGFASCSRGERLNEEPCCWVEPVVMEVMTVSEGVDCSELCLEGFGGEAVS